MGADNGFFKFSLKYWCRGLSFWTRYYQPFTSRQIPLRSETSYQSYYISLRKESWECNLMSLSRIPVHYAQHLRSSSKCLLWGKLRVWQQGRGPFQWWPPNYGMIFPKRLTWCQHCYLFGARSRPASSTRQLTTCVEFVFLLADPRIVVFNMYTHAFMVLNFVYLF